MPSISQAAVFVVAVVLRVVEIVAFRVVPNYGHNQGDQPPEADNGQYGDQPSEKVYVHQSPPAFQLSVISTPIVLHSYQLSLVRELYFVKCSL